MTKRHENYNKWFDDLTAQQGYIYCRECTEETDGNWRIFRNPYELCEHLKASLSEAEIAEARKIFDSQTESVDIP